MIEELLRTHTGKIIISIIWGLGLACIFKKICKEGKDCIKFKAPIPNDIISHIYMHDGKCYKYNLNTTKCIGTIIE